MSEAIQDRLGIGAAASALGVSVDTLRRWEKLGRVQFERDDAGRRTLPAADLARLLRERNSGGSQSARNRLEGTVVAVKVDGVMAQVELSCGPYRDRLADVTRGGGGARAEAGSGSRRLDQGDARGGGTALGRGGGLEERRRGA